MIYALLYLLSLILSGLCFCLLAFLESQWALRYTCLSTKQLSTSTPTDGRFNGFILIILGSKLFFFNLCRSKKSGRKSSSRQKARKGRSKLVEIGRNWSKLVEIGYNYTKIVQNHLKWFDNGSRRLFKMLPNGFSTVRQPLKFFHRCMKLFNLFDIYSQQGLTISQNL